MRKISFSFLSVYLPIHVLRGKKLGLLFSSFELDYVPLPFAAELLGLPAVGYWAFSFASGSQV
jgi:hypothetical protein